MKVKNIVLVDIRDSEKYITEHIRGSVSAPFNEVSKYSRNLDKSKTIVIISEKGVILCLPYNKGGVLMSYPEGG